MKKEEAQSFYRKRIKFDGGLFLLRSIKPRFSQVLDMMNPYMQEREGTKNKAPLLFCFCLQIIHIKICFLFKNLSYKSTILLIFNIL